MERKQRRYKFWLWTMVAWGVMLMISAIVYAWCTFNYCAACLVFSGAMSAIAVLMCLYRINEMQDK